MLHVALLDSLSSPPSAYLTLWLEPSSLCTGLCVGVEQLPLGSLTWAFVWMPAWVVKKTFFFHGRSQCLLNKLFELSCNIWNKVMRLWYLEAKGKETFQNLLSEQWLNIPCPGYGATGKVFGGERYVWKCFSVFTCPCRHFPFVSQGSFWLRMLLIKPGLLWKNAQPHANCAGKNSDGVGCVGSLSEGYIPWQEHTLPAAEIWKPDEVVEKWVRLEGPHMKIWVTEREDETVVSSGNDTSSLLLISSYRIWSMQLLDSPLTYTLLNHK